MSDVQTSDIVEAPIELSFVDAEPEHEDTPRTKLPDEQGPAGVMLVSVATFLSVAAAGWMIAGIFTGVLAKLVVVGGAVLGVGMVTLSYRTRTPGFWQYLSIPLAAVAGALLIAPDATGGSANLLGLVGQA